MSSNAKRPQGATPANNDVGAATAPPAAARSLDVRNVPGDSRWHDGWLVRILMLVAVLGIVLATYWPALFAGATYMDDKFYLGPLVRHPSWASVKAIFSEVFAPSMVNGYYQPLSLLSMMLDFLAPSSSSSLLPFHRTTLLLHLANVALIALLLYTLFGKWLTAAGLALLYGLHPLNADAVLWIAERKTVLSTCFALSSMLFYIAHARQEGRRDWKRYAASLFLYVCAVLSKPTTLPVAVLLPLLDYWPLQRLNRRALIEKIPFLIVCVVSALVTVISQAKSGEGGHTQFMNPFFLPLAIGYGLGFYLLKLVYPAGLISDYSGPHPFAITNPALLGCVIIAAGFAVAVALSARRTRAWLVGGLFFLIALLPTLGIIRYTSSIAANRSMYLPMVGLLLALGWQLRRWWDRGAFGLKAPLTRAIVVACVLGLATASALATRTYESHWSDSVTLLRYYISEAPNEWKFHTRLGNEWIVRRDYQSAIFEFRQAARLGKTWTENHLNLGRALFTVGQYSEAKESFATALQQTPKDWRAHVLMGTTLGRQEDPDGALREFRTAAELAPTAAAPHFNIANVLAGQGKLDEAAEAYRRTLRLDPRFVDAQRALDSITSQMP
jgi:Tfp pilus assembly protein PilF